MLDPIAFENVFVPPEIVIALALIEELNVFVPAEILTEAT